MHWHHSRSIRCPFEHELMLGKSDTIRIYHNIWCGDGDQKYFKCLAGGHILGNTIAWWGLSSSLLASVITIVNMNVCLQLLFYLDFDKFVHYFQPIEPAMHRICWVQHACYLYKRIQFEVGLQQACTRAHCSHKDCTMRWNKFKQLEETEQNIQ